MRFHFQPVAVHADRHADAVLAIDGKAALDDLDHLTVVRDRHRPGGIHGTQHVVFVDDLTVHADHAAAVDRRDVRAGQADPGRVDLQPSGPLGFIHRELHRFGRRSDIDHRAFPDASRGFNPDTQDTHLAAALFAGNYGADFCCSDVNSYIDAHNLPRVPSGNRVHEYIQG